MTYRFNNPARPTEPVAEIIRKFADFCRDNRDQMPVITPASYEVDGYDAQDDDMLELSDAEATYLERVLGIAS